MSDYIFELADSKTGDVIGELTRARDRQLVETLNKAGTFTCNLPLVDDLSELVEEVATCVRVKRQDESGLYVVEWSGPVWTIQEDTPNGLSIGCVGWLQTLEKRTVKPYWERLSYVAVDAGAVGLDVLLQSNQESDHSDTNFVVPGVAEPTQPRTQTIAPWGSVLGEIQRLSEVEAGYDMAVDPVTRELDVYAKIGSTLPDVVFEYGGDTARASRSSDASKICNRCIAYSAVGYAVAEDQESIAELGLFEEAISLSEVVDIDILQAFANGEVAVRSRPLRLTSFDPEKATSARPDAPRVLRDYRVGDIAYHKVDRGRLSISKQAHRIFGYTITWDKTGREQVSNLQTTAS